MIQPTVSQMLEKFEALSTSQTFEAGQVRYHYRAYRLEDRALDEPPIICLHGFKNNGHSFADLVPRLDRPAIAFDLRGFGRSHGPSLDHTSMIEYLCDLKRLFDHLELKRAVLLGHSLGARLSAVWASLFPETVERAILIDAYYRLYTRSEWPDRLKRWLEQVDTPLAPRKKIDLARIESFFHHQTPGIDPALARHLAQNSVIEDEAGGRRLHWAPYHQLPTPNLTDNDQMIESLSRMTMPTLILQATQTAALARELDVHNPNFTLRRIDGSHHLHWACPIEVAREIVGWWT